MAVKLSEDITALDLVCKIHKGISKQKAKNMIKYSIITCNGKVTKVIPSTLFKKGEDIEFFKQNDVQKKDLQPSKKSPVVIKYEDNDILIAIKPAGILSCKNLDQTGKSFDKVLENFISKRDHKKQFLWITHRIDREVEGLLLFAKSVEVQQLIKDTWSSVTKKYLALTEDRPPQDSGTVESFLKDTPEQKVISYQKEIPDSKFAKTEYRYIKTYGKYHLVEVLLHTGRKNQIRVHLAEIGCPIVGDRKYGADDKVVRQIRLIAYSLQFHHPINGSLITLEYEPRSKFFSPSLNKDESYKII